MIERRAMIFSESKDLVAAGHKAEPTGAQIPISGFKRLAEESERTALM